ARRSSVEGLSSMRALSLPTFRHWSQLVVAHATVSDVTASRAAPPLVRLASSASGAGLRPSSCGAARLRLLSYLVAALAPTYNPPPSLRPTPAPGAPQLGMRLAKARPGPSAVSMTGRPAAPLPDSRNGR